MTQRIRVTLTSPANDMVQEEIGKQLPFVFASIRNARFLDEGRVLECDAEDAPADLESDIKRVVDRVQRSLRQLQRKVVFSNLEHHVVPDRADEQRPGVHFLGPGTAALDGPALDLFTFFDRQFERIGRSWGARPLMTPTLIAVETLAKCDYFRSFPHNVTFAAHLKQGVDLIDHFRARHQSRETLDDAVLGDLDVPETCLSPATCYHVYHRHAGETVPASGLVYGVCGKCFRFEASNMTGLRRLWDFTMREVVYLGSREWVLEQRELGIARIGQFLDEIGLASEIRTASDPFFVAPDSLAKAYFQLSSDTKFELSALLPGSARLAIGSFNYHSDFFGRAFAIPVDGGAAMHSVCIAFGLERWVEAFFAQFGTDPAAWPPAVRDAIADTRT